MTLGRKWEMRDRFEAKTFFLEITMILGEKNSENRDHIEVKTFFLGITMILGRKKGNMRLKLPFFLENIIFGNLCLGP